MTAPAVALLPSLGRPASDFDDLVTRLDVQGHNCIAVDPQLHAAENLSALAAQTLAMIDATAGADRPLHLVGHAFGNRLARCIAADHPHRLASLTLLAAGGLVEPDDGVWTALRRVFDPTIGEDEQTQLVGWLFFAGSNSEAVPPSWRIDWDGAVAQMQRRALAATDRSHWWNAVAPRVLVVQGLQDRIATPENGRRYVKDLDVPATLAEIDGAGHALLPERPDQIADALLRFLSEDVRPA